MCKPFASLSEGDHQEFVCRQGKRPNPKPFLQQCEQPVNGQRNQLLALVRDAWEQYVRFRIDMASVIEGMEEIIAERRDQEVVDQEKDLAGSVVSATTATSPESDHEDIESPIHPHSSLVNTSLTSPISSAPSTPERGTKGDEGKLIAADGSKKEVDEDDEGSVHSLPFRDIGIPERSFSVAPSIETTSSEQSELWDDSVNTTGDAGLLNADQSLSMIAFDELLRPRHRGSVSGLVVPASPLSTGSGLLEESLQSPSSPTPLSPPSLNGHLRASIAFPTTTLQRIASIGICEESDEED